MRQKISTYLRFAMLAVALTSLLSGASATSLSEANDAYAAGKFQIAVKLYRKAAGEGESPALCYYNAANAYFQLDSLAQAVVFYRACIQNAPDFLKAHLNLAVCYYSLNDLGRCMASIERTLQIEPENQKALLIKAATLRACGATAKAVVTFENLNRLYPQMEEPYIALGEIYRELDDQEEATKWLELFPVGGKNSQYVFTLLADLAEKQGDIPRSIFYLNQAFDLDKTKRWTLYRVALLQQQSGSALVALETCRDGLTRFPDFADMAVLAGTISFERGRIDEAERFFNQGSQHGSPAAVVGLSNVRNWRKAHEAIQ
jgi:tetratricopeptide (TPR) repeat protein